MDLRGITRVFTICMDFMTFLDTLTPGKLDSRSLGQT